MSATDSNPSGISLDQLRTYVEGYPQGGRIERHSHEWDQLSLLAEGRSIGDIARSVGYDSPAAFSTAFKQCFGTPPSSYI